MDHYDNQSNNNWPPVTPPPTPVKQRNNMALASMIISIFGLLASCLPPLQFILGMLALLLAIFSKKGQPFCGFAIAGFIISIFCMVISIAIVAYIAFTFHLISDPKFAPLFNEMMEIYEQAYESMPAN